MQKKCLECGENLIVPEPLEVEQIIECENCGAIYEVVSIEPPKIELFEEEEK